jgi:hypothetical protein
MRLGGESQPKSAMPATILLFASAPERFARVESRLPEETVNIIVNSIAME